MAGEIIGVVPARGGSKGIHKKNLQKIGGISLVAWAIRAGIRSEKIDRLVLSTDDAEIAEVGEKEQAIIHHRPKELSTDSATTLSVLNELLSTLEKQGVDCRGVVLLEPTSPFRAPGLVDSCVDLFISDDTATVITVTQLERNPLYIFSVINNNVQRLIKEPDLNFSRRQDFIHLKRVNGCVYIHSAKSIRRSAPLQDEIKVVEMSAESSINIDTPLDLMFARLIFQNRQSCGINCSEILDERE